MIRSLQCTMKQDKEKFKVPRSVQDALPIQRLWADGIFKQGTKYSKTLRFSDINYAIASKEDKTAMFLGYSDLLNALDTGATTKLTIQNKHINRKRFEETILLPMQGDDLDVYRQEYNQMLLDKISDTSSSIVQERYLTISAHKRNIEDARSFFSRITTDLMGRLNHLDAHCEDLDAVERLRVLHDFYRPGQESDFHFDLRENLRRGQNFKDGICPDSLEFHKDYFVMGNKYGRVLFLKEFASYIKDSMITEFTSLNRSMMLSIDIIPVPTDEAVREMQNRLLGVETNVTNWQRRQNSNNNFSAVVPYDLEQQRKETREMLDDLTTRDQRMLFALVTLVHLADSKEQLDSDTEILQSTARKHLCQLATLNWQQPEGLVTALPFGLRKIDALRTLTTEALAVLMPFKAQEINDRGGIYYGQNVISKNLIIADRRELLNGNSYILGVSGSGKSFTAKKEVVNIILSNPNSDVILLDPEREYSSLVSALHGQVIHISATSPNHINAMDINSDYGDGGNPVVLKSEFLLSLCEQLVGSGKLNAKEKSIVQQNFKRELIVVAAGFCKFIQAIEDYLRYRILPSASRHRVECDGFLTGGSCTFIDVADGEDIICTQRGLAHDNLESINDIAFPETLGIAFHHIRKQQLDGIRRIEDALLEVMHEPVEGGGVYQVAEDQTPCRLIISAEVLNNRGKRGR